MNHALKRWLADWVPPHVRRQLRGQLPDQAVRYSGDFKSWALARRNSTGYDSPAILEKVKRTMQQVIDGRAAYERDSVGFERADYPYPVLAFLLRLAHQKQRPLVVADVGGSLGGMFYQCDWFVGDAVEKWCVVEQPAFAECGRRLVHDPRLAFFDDGKTFFSVYRPDLVLMSSVLPYVEDPHALIETVLSAAPACIVIDRTPVWDLPDRLTVQSVPPHIYGFPASYPAWIFNRQGLLNHFATLYGEVHGPIEFDALAGMIDVDGDWAKDTGFGVT